MALHLLAFDLGGSGCKSFLGAYDGQRLYMEEAGRFRNRPVRMGEQLYWNVPSLLESITDILSEQWARTPIDAYGIDSWGTSYGLVDAKGRLLTLPFHYRNCPYTHLVPDIYRIVPYERLRRQVACFPTEDITLFGLYGQKEEDTALYQAAERALLIPDLLQFFLTGCAIGEKTIMGTGGLLHPETGDLNLSLLDALGIHPTLFPPTQEPGTLRGTVSGIWQQTLGIGPVQAVATAEHDTQAAILAMPIEDESTAYLICGTWSLFGMETQSPVLEETLLDDAFCNELGVADTVCFLRNIQGMWLYEQCIAAWSRQGEEISHEALAVEAAKAKSFASLVDTDDALFRAHGDMPERIRRYCEKSGQPIPEDRGAIVRCIFESLCCKYQLAHQSIWRHTGRTMQRLRVGGGGSANSVLMQMVADALECEVLAGPKEASGIGNVLGQLMALGEVRGMGQARELAAHSLQVRAYQPIVQEAWREVPSRYEDIVRAYQANA